MTVKRYKGDRHMEVAYEDPQGDFVKYSDYTLLEEIAQLHEESSTDNAEEADRWFTELTALRKAHKDLQQKYELIQKAYDMLGQVLSGTAQDSQASSTLR